MQAIENREEQVTVEGKYPTRQGKSRVFNAGIRSQPRRKLQSEGKIRGGGGMVSILRLTPEQIEQMAVEIRELLLDTGIWKDTEIYFNRKRLSSHDLEDNNDRKHLMVEEDIEPQKYLEYVPQNHLLSMVFDGVVCDVIYHNFLPSVKKRLDAIFEKRGIYYEFITQNSMTCYYIAE